MLGACYDTLHVDHASNGAKGITVCKEWFSYEQYEKDILEILAKAGNPARYRLYKQGAEFSPTSILIV